VGNTKGSVNGFALSPRTLNDMQNLSFVGLSDDGTALILATSDGQRFRVPIDERLRSATRGGRAHMDVSEGPATAKDIQSRLRMGATPNEVADYSGWSVERVEAFAAPILQERAWVAEKAQKCQVGRGEEDPTLGVLVERRLGEKGIELDSIRWDAWRGEDGLWTVLLAYPAGKGDRVATWQYDVAASTLAPADDDAHWLSETQAVIDNKPRLIRVPNDDAQPTNAPVGNHPAGRQQSGATDGAQPAPAQPANTPAQPKRQPTAEPESDPTKWDNVLFGSPRDDRNY